MKIAWLSYMQGCQKPHIVQVFKNGHMIAREPFVTKTAAEDYISLNHPGAKTTDVCPTNKAEVKRLGLADKPVEPRVVNKTSDDLPAPRLIKKS